MATAGEVIRHYREAAGLSQEELAHAVRLSYGAISQYETGKTHPRRPVALRMDKLLHAGGAILLALGYAPDTDEGNGSLVNGVPGELADDVRAVLESARQAFATVTGQSATLKVQAETITEQTAAIRELVQEVNELRNELRELRSEVLQLRRRLPDIGSQDPRARR